MLLTRCHRRGNERAATPHGCCIRREGDDDVKMRNAAAMLALVPIACPLCLLRAQAQEESRSLWAGVYTEDHAKRGEPIYHKECAACHGDILTGGESAPPLTRGAFPPNSKAPTRVPVVPRTPKAPPPASP